MSNKILDNMFPPKKRIEPSDDNGNIWDNNEDAKEPEDIEEEEIPKQYVYILPCDLIDLWAKIKNNLNAIASGECSLKEVAAFIQEICYSHFAEKRRVDVENLLVFFDELSPQKSEYFSKDLFPFMARTALQIEHAFTEHPILLLVQEEDSIQIFTKQQVAILLCNMFFCTLHQQPCFESFPKTRDCSLLFMKGKYPQTNELKRQKLWFLFEYFTSLQNDQLNLDLLVSFERVYSPNLKEDIRSQQLKDECEDNLAQVQVHSKQKIEDNQNGLQVVFANKLVGGGVLGNGSIQEEIRYLISPECLVSLLLFEELQDLEALVIKGAQQISKYSGYKNSLQFEGPYDGKEPQIDVVNNMYKVTIVGIDALNYNKKVDDGEDDYIFPELSLESLMREIRKSYAGFARSNSYPTRSPRSNIISTGNWGCGDFGGDKEIKFFIQWIAASLAKVKLMNYHTYNDAIQEADIREVMSILGNSEVRDVYSIVREYIVDRKSNGKKNYEKLTLFQYIVTFYN